MNTPFYPTCVNCIHLFYKHGVPKCKAFGFLNIFNNKINYLPCITARSNEKYCGTYGLFWYGNDNLQDTKSEKID